MKIEAFYGDVFLKYGKISTDSRNIDKDSIFFALKGNSFNGNAFAANALNSGAAFCVVDDPEFTVDLDSRYLLVDNSLSFLQKLATFHRNRFNFPVMGITGTNGKTTTKELVKGIMSIKYKVSATCGNLNNNIGVPLSLLKTDIKNTNFCIIEMGANHPGEIADLCDIAKPNYGIITSIGIAHLEGFINYDNILKTKLALYKSVEKNNGTVFVNADNEDLMNNLPNANIVLYGSPSPNKSLFCNGIETNDDLNFSFKWNTTGNEYSYINTKMYGNYNFINMLAAACVGSYFNIDNKKISKFLSNYQPNNNRSEILKINNNTVICDAYNANPSSMNVAISSFANLSAKHKIIILGDMKELGVNSISEHEKILQKLSETNFEKVILIGDIFFSINHQYETYQNVEDAKPNVNIKELNNKTILLKGSRAIKLETLLT